MQAAPVHTGDVPALRKGLAVLELLAADGPLTLAEIQRRGALNKTMTFRLIRVLRETGYVRHDLESHRYSLALKLLDLGGAVAARLDIVRVGQPLLDQLRGEFGETINLGVMDELHIVYVAMAESSRPGLRIASRVGGLGCLHSTSIGKAILAFLPEPDRDALISKLVWTAVTPKTITNLDDLRDELERTRLRGYATDDEENEIGARCVGVPILDGAGLPLAGVSVSGPAARMNDDALDAMSERLWEASRKISSNLGYSFTTANGASPHPRRVGEV
jgi:IclR family transcriptional regulator, acetate operon repressor